jgi:hypothetical protein
MNARTQITIDPETQRRAQAKAAAMKISFAEYVRRLLVKDLGDAPRETDISGMFDLADTGPATDVARDKDKMIAEAIWDEHRPGHRKTTARLRIKTSRR